VSGQLLGCGVMLLPRRVMSCLFVVSHCFAVACLCQVYGLHLHEAEE
jgi:hypothetical protein